MSKKNLAEAIEEKLFVATLKAYENMPSMSIGKLIRGLSELREKRVVEETIPEKWERLTEAEIAEIAEKGGKVWYAGDEYEGGDKGPDPEKGIEVDLEIVCDNEDDGNLCIEISQSDKTTDAYGLWRISIEIDPKSKKLFSIDESGRAWIFKAKE